MRIPVVLLVLAPLFQEKDPDFAAFAKQCGTQIPWILDAYVPGDDGPGRDRIPPADRKSLYNQALEKAKASNRPVLWYAHRIEGRQMYRAALPDRYMMQVIWNDPDVADLVSRKFVPLKLCADNALGKLSAPDVVEPAIVILAPDGTKLHTVERIRTFNADWVLSLLTAVLAKHPKLNAAAKPEGSILEQAEEHLKGGDLDVAAVLLASPDAGDGAKAAYLKSQIARRRRNADEALEALEKAKGGRGELKALATVEHGVILLRQRKVEEAAKAFEEAAKSKSARQPEAKYWAAFTEVARGRDLLAVQKWARLVREHPASPWAWKAAANCTKSRDTTSDGAAMHLFEDPYWGIERAYGEPATTSVAQTPEQAEEAARRAVEFLLMAQRENGSWSDSRYAYWDGPHIIPNVWMSVTALAAAALLDWRELDPKRIDAALAKAEKHLLDESQMARGKNEECYAEAYRMQYWSRKYHASKEASKKSAAQKAMVASVDGLAGCQKAGGAWAHEYPNPFCTAVVLNSLMRAAMCKLEIPGRMVSTAADSIQKSRGADGGYAYATGSKASGTKDSMARMPVCELGLFIGKLAGPDAIEKAVAGFFEHLDKLERIRTCDFHTDGELGGFFFWHGMFHTSEAVVLGLKGKARDEALGKLLAHAMKVQELDGSFLDSHELGKSYGTAMALLTIRNARPATATK